METHIEPPRQTEVEIYGEPVAQHVTENEAYQAFAGRHGPTSGDDSLIFVAHYERVDGEWVKQGLDRHEVQHLFNHDGWPTD